MVISHFEQFLREATIRDPGAVSDLLLGPESMRRCGIDIHHFGLAMTGPAAADYILASHPDIN